MTPVVLRTVRQKREGLADLADIFVTGRFGKVPLNSIAEVIPGWQLAVIARRARGTARRSLMPAGSPSCSGPG